MYARYAFAIALFAVGCGNSVDETGGTPSGDTGTASGDSSTTTDSSSSTDSTTTTDTGSTTTETGGTSDTDVGDVKGVNCGGTVCASDEVCCASAGGGGATFTCTKGSCPDGGATISCDGPEDCTGGKICCAEVDVTGSGLSCGYKSGVADCQATCNTMIPTGCPGKATVRPCHVAADCTESGYKNCCTLSGMGTSATFCAPDFAKLIPGASCL
ncbi:MAG: hypothetical protein ACXVEE_29550 [Polyangiales bacterium]